MTQSRGSTAALLAVGVLVLASFTQAAVCPSGWDNTQRGKCVKFLSTGVNDRVDTWNDARTACYNAAGNGVGDLFSLHSAADDTLLRSYADTNELMWTGLYAPASSSVYRWSDGTSVDYTNYAAGYSLATAGLTLSQQREVVSTPDGTWAGVDTGMTFRYLCAQPTMCLNGIKDGAETDVDCGGADCGKCASAKRCSSDSDCLSSICDVNGYCRTQAGDACTANNQCLSAQCTSNVCAKGQVGTNCIINSDCITNQCSSGICKASISVNTAVTTDETNVQFTITLTGAASGGFTVAYTTADGTATVGDNDYTATSGSVTFTGTTGEAKTVTVPVTQDTKVEADETFTFTITGTGGIAGAYINVANAVGTATLRNTDTATIRLTSASTQEGGTIAMGLTSTALIDRDVTVSVQSASGTATSGTDFTALNAVSATLSANTLSTAINVVTIEDLILELDETLSLTPSNLVVTNGPRAVTLDTTPATGTILNDEVTYISMSNSSATEGSDVTFTITLDFAADVAIIATINTRDGTATIADSDYSARTNYAVTIPALSTSTTFTVSTTTDNIVEVDQKFTVAMNGLATSGRNVLRRGGSLPVSTGTIVNDDSAVVYVDDVSATEGSPLPFRVKTTNPIDGSVTVSFDTLAGTASNVGQYADYTDRSLTVTIPARTTSVNMDVVTASDNIVELDETVRVNLGNLQMTSPFSVTLEVASPSAVGTITNDDSATLSIGAVTSSEASNMVFTVTMSTDVDVSVSFNAVSSAGTATSPADFTAATYGLTIASMSRTATFTVVIVDDSVPELSETIMLAINSIAATGRSVAWDLSAATALGTITDNDSGTLTAASTSVTEGGAATITVTLSTALQTALSASWTVSPSSRTVQTSVSLTIAAGSTSGTVTVNTVDDSIVQAATTFTLELTSLTPVGIPITEGTRPTITINNDDTATVSVSSPSATEGNSLTYTLSMNKAADVDVSFTVATIAGTATATTDYTTVGPVTKTITAGQTSTTVTVNTVNDNVVELDETVLLRLSSLSASGRSVSLGADGTGTIQNDDEAVVSVSSGTVTEPDDDVVTITISNPVDVDTFYDLVVNILSADPYHASASDVDASYAPRLTITAGSTSVTGTVPVNDDSAVEFVETFTVSVTPFAGGNAGRNVRAGAVTATQSIVDDDSSTFFMDAATVTEGGTATVTGRLSAQVSQQVSFTISLQSNTATVPGDAPSQSITLTFSAGTTSVTGSFSTTQDSLVELNEVANMVVTGSSIGTASISWAANNVVGTLTINNDDTAALSCSTATAYEGGTLTFTISLSNAVDVDISTTISATSGTATAGVDYPTFSNVVVSFTAGTTSRTVNVATTQDTLVELDETIGISFVSVSASGRAYSTSLGGMGTIINDDSATVSLSSTTVTEGSDLVVTATLTAAVDIPLTLVFAVDVNDAAVTASNADLSTTWTSTQTLSAGSTSLQVLIPTTQDTLNEADETFRVSLIVSGITNRAVSPTSLMQWQTIIDDDVSTLTASPATVAEGSSVVVNLAISTQCDHDVTYNLATGTTGTATVGNSADVAAQTWTVTFPALTTTATITVATLDDNIVEATETLPIIVTGFTDWGRILAPTANGVIGTVSITSSDAAVATFTGGAQAAEGQSAVFNLALSNPVDVAVTVTVSTTDGTALAGSDYTALTQTAVTFNALSQTASVSVVTLTDGIQEGTETFTIAFTSITPLSRALSYGSSATGSILNNDQTTTTLSCTTTAEGGNSVCTLTLTNAVDVDVDYAATFDLSDPSTTASSADVNTAYSGTVTVPANALSVTFNMATTQDNLVEATETFRVKMQITNSRGRSLNPDPIYAWASITDNDSSVLTANSGTNGEGSSIIVAFHLSNPVDVDISFVVQAVGGTAVLGVDLPSQSRTITFTAGTTSTTGLFSTTSDNVVELDETATVAWVSSNLNSRAVTVASPSNMATLTITNDDTATVTVTQTPLTVEGQRITFAVVFSNPVDVDVTMMMSTVDTTGEGFATVNVDYVPFYGVPIVMRTGYTATESQLDVIADTIVELAEKVPLVFTSISSSSRSVSAATPAPIVIPNDDFAALSATANGATEGGAVTGTITISNQIDAAVIFSVAFSFPAGTTASPADVNTASVNVTIAAGATTGSFSLPTIDDAIVEAASETVRVGVMRVAWNGRNVDSTIVYNTVSIADNDVSALTATGATVTEGAAATINFALSKAVDRTVTFTISLAAGTATLDADAPSSSQTLTFVAGATSGSLSFATTDDSIVEPTETLKVVGATLDVTGRSVSITAPTNMATITINSDDSCTVTLNAAFAGNEDSDVQGTVTLSNLVAAAVTFTYTTSAAAGQTATPNVDFTVRAAQSVTVPAMTGSFNFAVGAKADNTVEADETFTVTLNSASSSGLPVTLGAAVAGVATITNDDQSVISIVSRSGVEGATFTFTITLSKPLDVLVALGLSTTDGTATLAGADYSQLDSHTVSFAAGVTTATAELVTTQDSVVEADETVLIFVDSIRPVSPRNVVSNAQTQGTMTITNDDSATLSCASATANEGNSLSFTYSLTNMVDTAVSFKFCTADSTALAASDYVAFCNVLTIAAGSTSGVKTIATVQDSLVEDNEAFRVQFTDLSASGRQVSIASGQFQATGNILNDDSSVVSIVAASANEGQPLSFQLALTNPVDIVITLSATTTDGTATAASGDYTALSGSVQIPAATTSAAVTVATTSDSTVELSETLTVTVALSNVNGRSVTLAASPSAVGTIVNDDTCVVTVANGHAAEGNPVVFPVTLTNPVDVAVQFQAVTSAVPSASTNDFTSFSGTVTVPANSASGTLSVTTTQDNVVELNEQFTVAFSTLSASGRAVTLNSASAVGTIENEDSSVVSVNSVSVTEGSSAVFTITLSNPVDADVAVTAATASGTAISGTDFSAYSGASTIASLSTTATFSVSTTQDAVVELDETFTVSLSNLVQPGRSVAVSSGAGQSGTGTITNDDNSVLSVAAVASTVAEGGVAQFRFTLTQTVDVPVVITYATYDIGAAAGSDYTAASTTASIPAGSTSVTVSVATTGDSVVELDEAFGLSVSSIAASGRAVSVDNAANSASVTIINDDAADVTLAAASAVEGSPVTFTASLSRPVDTAVTFRVSTVNGTANTADRDFTALTNVLVTVAAGATSATFTVPTTADTKVELDETFTVSLSALLAAGRNVASSVSSAVGTITNNDFATLSWASATNTEGSGIVFTITSSAVVDAATTVTVTSTAGTATANDFTAVNTNVIIAAGATATTLTVATTQDNVVELAESFTLTMTVSALGRDVRAAANSVTGTISNDDSAVMTIADASATEGATLTFTATLSNPVDVATSFAFSAASGTATLNTDFPATATTVTFAALATTASYTVASTQDAIVEAATETFSVSATASSIAGRSVTVSPSGATGSIIDDDRATVTIDPCTAVEGSLCLFTVKLSNAVDVAVSAVVDTADATATVADNDYSARVAVQVDFPAGTTSVTFSVATTADTKVELDETLNLQVSSLISNSRSMIVSSTNGVGVGTISNNDAATVTAASVSVTEGSSVALVLTLSNPVDVDVSVRVTTSDGTARDGSDFTGIANTVTITAGQLTGSTNVVTMNDNVVEPAETCTATLTNVQASGRSVTAGAAATITINDEDRAVVIIANATAIEGDPLNFNIQLSNPVASAVVVRLVSTVRTASTADFTVVDRTITIAALATSATLTVATTKDTIVEATEEFLLTATITTGVGSAVTGGTGWGIITDDDSATLSITGASQAEGTAIVFTISLSATVDTAISFNLATVDGTAVAASDYTAVSTVASIAALGTSTTLRVTVTDDTIVELDESFTVVLSNVQAKGRNVSPVNPTTLSATGTIRNNDAATAFVETATATEGTPVQFFAKIDKAVDVPITVNIATTDNTALVADNDYVAFSGTVQIPAGDLSAPFEVITLQDNAVELNEKFNVKVNSVSASGRSVTASTTVVLGNINNDDSAVLQPGSVTVVEGDTAQFTLALSNPVDVATSFTVATKSGTATTGVDFTAVSQSVTFNAGVTSMPFTVITVQDAIVELDETFVVQPTITSVSGRSVTVANGAGTITNDDKANILVTDVTQAEAAGTMKFTVNIDAAIDTAITVSYSTVDGTATAADSDYTAASGTLQFSGVAGQTYTINVPVIDDFKVEPSLWGSESFRLVITPTTIAGRNVDTSDFGVGYIVNDDLVSALTVASTTMATRALTFTATFPAPVSGLTTAGFVVNSANLAIDTRSVAMAADSKSAVFTVNVGTPIRSGSLSVYLKESAVSPANFASNTISVLYVPPTVTISPVVGSTVSQNLAFDVKFSQDVSFVTASAFTVAATFVTVSSRTLVQVNPSLYRLTIAVTPATADTITVTLPEAAGTVSPANALSNTASIAYTPTVATLSSTLGSTNLRTYNRVVDVMVTFGSPIANVVQTDLSLALTGGATATITGFSRLNDAQYTWTITFGAVAGTMTATIPATLSNGVNLKTGGQRTFAIQYLGGCSASECYLGSLSTPVCTYKSTGACVSFFPGGYTCPTGTSLCSAVTTSQTPTQPPTACTTCASGTSGACQDPQTSQCYALTAGGTCPSGTVSCDDCVGNGCLHGRCIDGLNSYSCACDDGWYGTLCQLQDQCASSPCKNGGVCTNTANGYICSCPAGFTGPNCQTNNCVPSPCANGGVCLPDSATPYYRCQCAAGFTGAGCTVNIDDCAASPCKNGATCVDGIADYTCRCANTWTGKNCDVQAGVCAPNPCQNGGQCIQQSGNTYQCVCAAGFTGANCQNNINDCLPNPCASGATCVDGIDSFTCTCPPGYGGARCDVNINECAPAPCQNGGTCTDGIAKYTCTCVAGFSGTNCEVNIDDCSPNPCANGGTCTDGVRSYSCRCPVGYTGSRCEVNPDDCIPGVCLNGGTCVDGVNSYSCVCRAGFTGPLCGTNIDDCSPNPCFNGGVCVDGVASYTCNCAAGYTGARCATDINDCAPNPCLNGATCVDKVNGYQCNCAAGWTGATCNVNIDDCTPNPCQNRGTCTDKVNGYQCTCAAGWSGATCGTNIDDCTPNPCANGGQCIDGINSFTCACPTGFSGNLCQVNVNDCDPNPCQNGATCVDGVNAYTCNCAAGYNGNQCQVNINDCDPNPCRNGGSCTDRVNGYTCTCPAGFTGSTCNVNIDDCAPAPCKNRGTCVDKVNGYTCQCAEGWTGSTCETRTSACAVNQCANGGTCSTTATGFVCTCPPGFQGTTCSQTVCPSCVGAVAGPCGGSNGVCYSYLTGTTICPPGTRLCGTDSGSTGTTSTKCTDCVLLSSGPCRQPNNGVCYDYMPGDGKVCPPGTLACAPVTVSASSSSDLVSVTTTLRGMNITMFNAAAQAKYCAACADATDSVEVAGCVQSVWTVSSAASGSGRRLGNSANSIGVQCLLRPRTGQTGKDVALIFAAAAQSNDLVTALHTHGLTDVTTVGEVSGEVVSKQDSSSSSGGSTISSITGLSGSVVAVIVVGAILVVLVVGGIALVVRRSRAQRARTSTRVVQTVMAPHGQHGVPQAPPSPNVLAQNQYVPYNPAETVPDHPSPSTSGSH